MAGNMEMNPPLHGGAAGGANKWIIAITVMFGAFMAVMDISVVNVALPYMEGSFGKNLSEITWVATSYSIAEIITVTMAGWWSTVLGRRRLYLLSFAVFTIGSMLAGMSASFTQMLIFRTIQGFGGGSLIPVSQAIMRETFPDEEQGMAMAIYSMGVVLAPGIGPIIGGYLTDRYGWPWIFYINVVVAIPAMLMVSAFVHDPPYLRRGIKKVDWVGIGLLALGLTGLQIVLERGQESDWFNSQLIVWGSILTAIVLIALVFWELHVDEPVINLRLLRNFPLTLGSTMGLIFGIGLAGTTFVLPQFTQDLLGYNALQSGLVLLPRAIGLFLLMPVAGWLYNYVDSRLMIFAGLAFMCWSYWDLSRLSLQADFWSLVPMLLIMGVGMPFMFVTLSTVSLSMVPRHDMTSASSFYTLTRRVGGNIGYALVATVVADRIQVHRSILARHINPFSDVYRHVHDALSVALAHQGLTALSAKHVATGILNQMINRQSTMMAYNDLSLLLGLMFVCIAPLILFFPRRKTKTEELKEAGVDAGE